MKMIKAKEKIKNENVEETKLEDAFVLWKHKAKSGLEYLSGNTPKEKSDSISLVGFFNKNKKNPKEPDVRIYALDEEGNQADEVCSLWENTAKSGSKYLSGLTSEKDNVVAFYNEIDETTKIPYIRAYYKQV